MSNARKAHKPVPHQWFGGEIGLKKGAIYGEQFNPFNGLNHRVGPPL